MNSKATLRITTKELLPMIPKLLRSELEASRYHAKNSKSLVIQGDGSRNRTDNVQECYKKLHALIVAAGKNTVKGETSPAQLEKVKNLYDAIVANTLSLNSLADSLATQATQR